MRDSNDMRDITHLYPRFRFLAATSTKQLYKNTSVGLSARLQVRLSQLFHNVSGLSSYYYEIFRGYTIDKSDVHVECQGRRSEVKVTEVKTNSAPIWAFPDCKSSLNPRSYGQKNRRFCWIHRWLWNNAQSLV